MANNDKTENCCKLKVLVTYTCTHKYNFVSVTTDFLTYPYSSTYRHKLLLSIKIQQMF